MGKLTRTRSSPAALAAKQRRLQRTQDARDRAREPEKADESGPMQAGPREQPVELPAQHLAKPGNEADLQLKPRFLAPDYRGSGKLAGMVAVVTGGDSGIGRSVAVPVAREGADGPILYLSEHADAGETGRMCRVKGVGA